MLASSRILSKMQVRVGDSGAMASSGRVTQKWGERRWKVMLRKSWLRPWARDPIADDTSFCQFERVLTTRGVVRSKTHPLLRRGVFLLLRANQRKFCTCMEKTGGISRSAWKVRISGLELIFPSSQCRGNSQGDISTSMLARRNIPWANRKGNWNLELVSQRTPVTRPSPASADSIQRATSAARRRV